MGKNVTELDTEADERDDRFLFYAPLEPGLVCPFTWYPGYWSDRIAYARKNVLQLTQEELSDAFKTHFGRKFPRVTIAKYETRPPKKYTEEFEALVLGIIELVRIQKREGWSTRALEAREDWGDLRAYGITKPATTEDFLEFARDELDGAATVEATIDIAGGYVRATESVWREILPLPPTAFNGVPAAPVPPDSGAIVPYYFGFDVGIILEGLITGRTYTEVLADWSDATPDEARGWLAVDVPGERIIEEVRRNTFQIRQMLFFAPLTDEEYDEYDAWETANDAREREAAKAAAKKPRSNRKKAAK